MFKYGDKVIVIKDGHDGYDPSLKFFRNELATYIGGSIKGEQVKFADGRICNVYTCGEAAEIKLYIEGNKVDVFNIGDKVKVVEGFSRYKTGDILTVKMYNKTVDDSQTYYGFLDDDEAKWKGSRFVLHQRKSADFNPVTIKKETVKNTVSDWGF